MFSGFIKIHRKFLKWEWYSDNNVKSVFLHLLLTARFDDGRWRGHEVKAGQVIIGVNKLAKELGLTPRQIRTALDKLKTTGEIDTQTTNKFTLVTLVNYGVYQSETRVSDKQKVIQMTNERQTKNSEKQRFNGNDPKLATNKTTNKSNAENIHTQEVSAIESVTATNNKSIKWQTNDKQMTNERQQRKNDKNEKNDKNSSSISEILKVYSELINPVYSPTVVDTFKGFLNDMEKELIIKAIEVACDNNAKNFKYIEAILSNCLSKGILTLDAYEKKEADFKSKKKNFKQMNERDYSHINFSKLKNKQPTTDDISDILTKIKSGRKKNE